MTEYIVSDVHIYPMGRPHPGRKPFHDFLDHLSDSEPGRLWILGDLFDYWFEYRSVMPSGYSDTLCRLRSLRENGWQVTFIPGNHDWWCGKALEESSGMEVIRESVHRVAIQGIDCVLAHGDGLGRGDTGYRIMKPLIRSKAAVFLFSLLHPDLATSLAGLFSNTSKRILRKKVDVIPEFLSRWAASLESDGVGIVITGHTHCPVIARQNGLIHASPGDWISHFTYLTIQEGEIKLNEYRH